MFHIDNVFQLKNNSEWPIKFYYDCIFRVKDKTHEDGWNFHEGNGRLSWDIVYPESRNQN